MKKKIGSRKGIVIVAGMVVLVLVIGLSVFVRGSGREAYRSIRIVELNGEVMIERAQTGTLEAMVNMNLMSGDSVSTGEGAYAVLRLDTDKYVMLGECGAMEVIAEGNEASGRTSIRLASGSVLNEIQNPLGESSTYEIVTPNATMSVRGTVFEVRNGEDGKISVLVYDGRVEVSPQGLESALYYEGEYTEFTKDGIPEYITERGIISSEQMKEQMWRRLRQIESEGRNVNYGIAGAEGEADSETKAIPAQEPAPKHSEGPWEKPGTSGEPEFTPEVMERPEASEEPSKTPGSNEEPKVTSEPGEEPELTPEPSEEPSEPPETAEPGGEPTEPPRPGEEPSEPPETAEPSEEPTEPPKPGEEPSEPPVTAEPGGEPTEPPRPGEEPLEPSVTPEPSEEPTEPPKPDEEPSEPSETAEPGGEPTEPPRPGEEPSESPEPSEEPSMTPNPSPEPSESPQPSDTPSVTPEPSEEPTEPPRPSEGPSVTPKPGAEPSESPKPSEEPEETPKPSEEPSETPEPSEEPEETPRPSEEPEETPKPSGEPPVTPNPSPEPSETPQPSGEPPVTPKPSEEPSEPPRPSEEPEETPEPSREPSESPQPSGEPTASPQPSEEPTVTPLPEEGERKTVTYYLPYIALNYEKDGTIYAGIKEEEAYNYGTEDVAVGTKLKAPGTPDIEATPMGYAAEKADFTFAGWCTEQEAEWDFHRDTVQEDMTLYPIWVDSEGRKYYPVVYEAPEAEFAVCNSIMIGAIGYEQPDKAELPQPVREGYILSGWERISAEDSILVRFRAVWEKQGDS